VAYELGKTGAPVLTDALAYFECSVAASLEFGTHTIFVGRVLSFGEGVGRPLLFYRGKYTVLTETI
jgi:flavin reductase (DIM6/NTAB) family NADH-FMN oxidoreductase RutF